MVWTSCAMGLLASSSFDLSVLYVVFRAAEESAKLSNTVLLGGLCEELYSNSGSDGEPKMETAMASKAALLAKAVALQKMMGSVLKICASLLCSASVRMAGVDATLLFGSGICALGTLWIFKIMPAVHANTHINMGEPDKTKSE